MCVCEHVSIMCHTCLISSFFATQGRFHGVKLFHCTRQVSCIVVVSVDASVNSFQDFSYSACNTLSGSVTLAAVRPGHAGGRERAPVLLYVLTVMPEPNQQFFVSWRHARSMHERQGNNTIQSPPLNGLSSTFMFRSQVALDLPIKSNQLVL